MSFNAVVREPHDVLDDHFVVVPLFGRASTVADVVRAIGLLPSSIAVSAIRP